MANEDISRLPKWAKQRLGLQAQTIIELKKQIEELKGEFRTGTRILRSGLGIDDDIAVGDANDRFYFYTKFYDPDNQLDGGRIEVYVRDGGLQIFTMDAMFIRPGGGNSATIYDGRHNTFGRS